MSPIPPSYPSSPTIAFLPRAEAEPTLSRWLRAIPQPLMLARGAFAGQAPAISAIRREEDQALVGLIGLQPGAAPTTLAFALWIDPAFRENGLGTQAGQLLLQSAFGEWSCRRLETAHRMQDIATGRLASKLGFLPEGVQRQVWQEERQWIDLAHHALLQSDL